MFASRHVSGSVRASAIAQPKRMAHACALIGWAAACAALVIALASPPSAAQTCAGDCNGNGEVSSDETLIGANLVLGTLDLRSCPSADADGSGAVAVGEAVAAVRGSIAGCSGTGAALHPRVASGPAQIELGTVTGSAGAQVTFEATLHDNGNVVAATQNDIAFDPLTPIISCEENPAIDKEVFIGFQPFGCTPGVDCTAVRVIVLSLSNVDPIPDGAVLYSCTVAINFTAPDGTYPLLSSNEGASTPDGMSIDTEGIDGAVIVDGGAVCAGDCDGSGSVAINELIHGLNILANNGPLAACPAADINGNGTVTIDESVAATGNAFEGCGTHPSGPLGSIPVQIAVGSTNGTAGTEASFAATLHTMGASVVSTQNDIAFDPLTPISDCEPNAALDKNGTFFVHQPSGCTLGVDCTSIRAVVTSLSNFDLLPDGAELYTCTVEIDSGAPDGTYPLQSSNEHASTPRGRPNPVFATDGVVTVGDPSPPSGTRIIAGDATGVIGQVVSIAVGLETDADVAGTENELAFDAGTPIVFSSCVVNPDIDKPNSAFGFRPISCMPGINCSGVKAIIISFSDLSPIPNGSTLYSCDVFILPSASPGQYPLDCFAPGAATPVGQPIDTDCVDGEVTVLPDGPPVAAATLILQRARLRANTSASSRSNGSLLLAGVVNANAPFDGLIPEMLASGVSAALSGAGGIDVDLSWDAAQCTTRDTARGPKVDCVAEDANGRRRLTLRPTRTPNLLGIKVTGSRLALMGPFTVDPVGVTVSTTGFQRPDSIGSCTLRRQGTLTNCRETGIVP
jgi:hypothetical protein